MHRLHCKSVFWQCRSRLLEQLLNRVAFVNIWLLGRYPVVSQQEGHRSRDICMVYKLE